MMHTSRKLSTRERSSLERGASVSLEADLRARAERHDRAGQRAAVLESAYVEVVATRA